MFLNIESPQLFFYCLVVCSLPVGVNKCLAFLFIEVGLGEVGARTILVVYTLAAPPIRQHYRRLYIPLPGKKLANPPGPSNGVNEGTVCEFSFEGLVPILSHHLESLLAVSRHWVVRGEPGQHPRHCLYLQFARKG